MQKEKSKAELLAVDTLIYLLNMNVFRCYILMYVSFILRFAENGNPLPILTNTVHYQFSTILDHIFQNGIAPANYRLQVMPSSETSDSQLIFLRRIS